MKNYYTVEFKRMIITEFMESSLTSYEIADKYNIPASNLQQWARWAKEHGLASIRASDKRTGYDISFVADVLQYLKTDSTTVQQTAKHFKISHVMIDTWYSHFKSGGIAEVRRHLRGASPMNKNKRKASKGVRKNNYEQRISELEEQLENAKLENLILKKLQPQSKPSQTEKKLK